VKLLGGIILAAAVVPSNLAATGGATCVSYDIMARNFSAMQVFPLASGDAITSDGSQVRAEIWKGDDLSWAFINVSGDTACILQLGSNYNEGMRL